MTHQPLTPQELDLLRQVDTPTVCNVIELFDVRPRRSGFMDQSIRCCYPKLPPMVGYAVTATFGSAYPPPRGKDVYGGLVRQVELFARVPAPPIVVFQDLEDPPIGATFGEVMCSTYKAFGAAGLVTSGTGRDLDQVQRLDFPVFTSGTTCSHAYCHIVNVDVPVKVGGLAVHPGDLLHGDRNGVTTIPQNIAKAVAHACRPFMDAEEEILGYLRRGNPTLDGFAGANARCKAKMQELAARCRAARE